MYYVIEEASEAIYSNTDSLQEAIEDANSRRGKFLVVDDEDIVLYDTQPNVSYKI